MYNQLLSAATVSGCCIGPHSTLYTDNSSSTAYLTLGTSLVLDYGPYEAAPSH